MNKSEEDYIKYRFSRAIMTLEEAKILAEKKHWNACANRLYYSCFYAVSALLFKFKLSSSKHTGIRSLFNHQFIQTGKISKELAETYNDLFEKRQEGDYEDFTIFNEADISSYIARTEKFLSTINEFVEVNPE
jgi:uncharacterized protein (UPF0332 family)